MTVISGGVPKAWHDAAQMERSRLRALLERSKQTRRDLAAAPRSLFEVVARTRELVTVSRNERAARRAVSCRIAVKPREFLEILQSAGFNEADLPAIIDELIEAYQTASALGEEKAVALIGRALRRIGRHLAHTLGPRAAGVLLN